MSSQQRPRHQKHQTKYMRSQTKKCAEPYQETIINNNHSILSNDYGLNICTKNDEKQQLFLNPQKISNNGTELKVNNK